MSEKEKYTMVPVCIDIETTGLFPEEQEIIEIAIVVYNPRTYLPTSQKFHKYIKPQRPENINPKAMELNKINIDEIPEGNTPDAIKSELIRWISEQDFGKVKLKPIGHNYASFDLPFIKTWLTPKTYNDHFHYRPGDTCAIARVLVDAGIINPERSSLAALCKYYGISEPPHSALEDVYATLKVYAKLIDELHPAVSFWRGLKYYLALFPNWLQNIWYRTFSGKSDLG